MKPEMHISFDIETLSSRSDGAIISIGAVAFTSQGISINGFHEQISPVWAVGHRDENTWRWWKDQSSDVRGRAFSGLAGPREVLQNFSNYVKNLNPEHVWANGPQFDCVLLRNLYRELDMNMPFHYRTERDFRTLMQMAIKKNINYQLTGTNLKKHDAYDDAIRQAEQIHVVLTSLGTF